MDDRVSTPDSESDLTREIVLVQVTSASWPSLVRKAERRLGAVHQSQLEGVPGSGFVGSEHCQGPGVVRRHQKIVRIAMSKVAIQAGEMLFDHVSSE